MVDLVLLFLIVIIVIDFAISIWNGYASGRVFALLRGRPGNRFAKVAAASGLGLAFAGMAYVMLIIFGFLAWFIGYLGPGDVTWIISFDFLVFGAMIIGFGLVVTAQSIAIAYHQRNFGAIAISAWNVFAEVWDIAIYIEGFQAAYSGLGAGRDRVNIAAVAAIAILVAFFIVYAAFRHGMTSTQESMDAAPRGSAAGSSLAA